MPMVVLPDHSHYSVAAAQEFGEIVYLSTRKLDPLNPAACASLFRTRLEQIKFDPDNDFICLTGHQLTTALYLAVVTAIFPTVRLLMFDARTSSYCERVFSTESIRKGEVAREARRSA